MARPADPATWDQMLAEAHAHLTLAAVDADLVIDDLSPHERRLLDLGLQSGVLGALSVIRADG